MKLTASLLAMLSPALVFGAWQGGRSPSAGDDRPTGADPVGAIYRPHRAHSRNVGNDSPGYAVDDGNSGSGDAGSGDDDDEGYDVNGDPGGSSWHNYPPQPIPTMF
jgi:hypothetical protein